MVGDSTGRVHCFDANWQITATFRAHTGPVLLCQLAGTGTSGSSGGGRSGPNSVSNQQPLLVTVGQSDDRNPLAPQLCCWNLAKAAAAAAAAVDGSVLMCVRTARLAAQPISLAVSDNGQCMAVGYAEGAIQLFRADAPGKSGLAPWSRTDATMEALELRCPGAGTIVGMAFKLAHRTLQLFVCGELVVAVFVLPGAGLADTLVVLDRLKEGKRNRCCVMQRPEQTLGGGTLAERHFMVGQDDVSEYKLYICVMRFW